MGSPVDKAEHIAKKIISPKLKIDIPYWVANDARTLVLAELKGTFESAYTKAPQLVTTATSLNPNSIRHFSWTKEGEDNTFESVILAYDAQIKGFLNGCRKVIGLDGAHLNGKLGGTMLAATGIDGQNGVYPICVMFTTSETEENWLLMSKELRKKIPNMDGLTFISDRMKGILESVKRLFPLANHRYCLRHLYLNFMTKGFRNPRLTYLLWKASKAYKYKHWEKAMQEMAGIDPKAYQYLIDAEPKSWARTWFPHDVACEHIYSNFSESFNNMSLKIRNKPLTQMVYMYTHLVMVLFSKRRKLASTWQMGDIVPAGKDLIEVMSNLRDSACLHAVKALFLLNPDWAQYCSKCYTVDYYRTTYSWSMTPLGDIDEYENNTGINIIHPHRLRDKGRPCVKRKKSWYEKNKPRKRVAKCSVCKGLDHNILTCQGPPVGSNPKKKGVRMECSVNGDEFCITAAPTKKMRKALSAPNTASTSASKKSAEVPPLSKGKAAATTPSTSSAGSQKKGKTTTPSSSTAPKRKVTHPSTSSTPSSACFNQTYHGTFNISRQTINIFEPPSKRVRNPNSKYQ
ncbi:uncharacterized protein LOC113326470 [Papaver somniferum]|uniref:uncharacterized protein LOC113326470 n=1 Tax=Papaver somniferum TaxID=3469 RepID=UPI000E700A1D|nr:uncharacterized protein LOC113326470 [Papaver somniferum]